MAQQECESVESRLSRYLDNDLPAEAATDVAAHLATCDSCRREHDDLSAVRNSLRVLPALDSDAVRERVFVRLERVARVAEAGRQETKQRLRSRFGWAWLFAPGTRRFAGAMATVMLGAVFAGSIALFHGGESATDRAASGAPAHGATPVELPAASSMETLFQLHDARAHDIRAASVAQVTDTPPAPSGQSEASPAHDDNTHSGTAATSGGDRSQPDSDGDVASDEVPEAL